MKYQIIFFILNLFGLNLFRAITFYFKNKVHKFLIQYLSQIYFPFHTHTHTHTQKVRNLYSSPVDDNQSDNSLE